ncbi:MAG: transcriptional repressor [Nitrospinae bacterium]|nr:transcriptional repressor [Nitrospinota bacterium]
MSRVSSGGQWLKRYHDFLTRNGLKSTIQRDLIVEEFTRSTGHISADELHLKLRAGHPSIGLATVYRTLKILSAAGLAKERRFNDGLIRYEFAGPDGGHHDHMVCLTCGRVEEFENEDIEELQRKVAGQHGFKMTDHRLEIYGHCAQCASRREKA